MKRIIVTGATSMIGTALIEECIRHDIEVYAVVRAGSSKTKRLPESARIHQIECELEKLEELPAKITGECDTFFHIAWGNTGENRNSSTELQSRNVFYTLKAVRAAHAMGCKRFIGAGSQAEYGPMDVPRIAPDSPVHPTTPYGASKLAANQLSFMLCKELGMEWIWPRIFSVYGIYEKETTMIASGLRKMLKGEKTEFTPAEQRWDYLYSKGGMAVNAAAIDTRIKATVASTMYDMSRVNANGYFDSMNADQRYELRRQLNEQRTVDAKNGSYALGGGVVDPLPDEAPGFVKDYHNYYKTGRGYHKRSLNSNGGWNKTSSLSFINMPLLSYSNEIRSAVLMIHGEKAHSRYFSETAYGKLTGDNKELLIIPGANHTDLYDQMDIIPFEKLKAFFEEYLK